MQASFESVVESELKLRLPAGVPVERLIAFLGQRAALGALIETHHEDTYLDTPAGDLRQAGLGARVRTEGIGRFLVLKPILLDPGAMLVRQEVGRRLEDGESPGATLACLAESELGLRLSPLPTPLLVLRTTRRRGCLQGEQFEAEFCDDRVEARTPEGRGPAAFREVELELQSGDGDALLALAHDAVATLGLAISTEGKYPHALGLLGLPGPTYAAEAAGLAPGVSANEMVRAQLLEQLARIHAYAPGAAVGLDPAQLHRMRVATRRLRAGLQVFRRSFPKGVRRTLRTRFGALGRVLGRQRDLDVQLDATRRDRLLLRGAPAERLRAHLIAERDQARAATRAFLHGAAFAMLLADAERALRAPPPPKAPAGPAAALAARVLRREAKRFAKRIQGIHDHPAAHDLHRLRIAGKRLRYAVELLEPVLAGEVGALVERLKHSQDALGAFQDDIVLLERDDVTWEGEAGQQARRVLEARVADPRGFLDAVLLDLRVKKVRKALRATARRLERETRESRR